MLPRRTAVDSDYEPALYHCLRDDDKVQFNLRYIVRVEDEPCINKWDKLSLDTREIMIIHKYAQLE